MKSKTTQQGIGAGLLVSGAGGDANSQVNNIGGFYRTRKKQIQSITMIINSNDSELLDCRTNARYSGSSKREARGQKSGREAPVNLFRIVCKD